MGFAAEIKEFLGAANKTVKLMSDTANTDALTKQYQTTTAKTQKDMDNPLNDLEQQAKIDNLNQRTKQSQSSTSLQDLARRQLLAAQHAPSPSALNTQPVAPATGIPADTERAVQAPTQEYARGGLVKKFAVGGYVDDDDEDDVSPSYPGGYPPAVGGAAPTSAATDFSAQSRRGAIPTPSARPAGDPVSEGLKYGVTAAGLNGALPPMAKRSAYKAYALGAGGAPIDDMLQSLQEDRSETGIHARRRA
jgi:hypothetical protein